MAATEDQKRKPLSTGKQIQSLKPEGVVYEHAIKDGKGLRIKVSAAGKRSWYYRYRNRHTGALERMKLGEHPGMTLADARAEVDRLRGVVAEHSSAKLHRDVERKRKAVALAAELAKAQEDEYTLQKLVEDYLKVVSDEKRVNGPRGQRYIRSWPEVQRALHKYVLQKDAAGCHSAIAHKPAKDVTDDDIKLILADLPPVQANRLRAYVSALYTFAMKSKRAAQNPAAMIDKNIETPRTRHLLDGEIRVLLADLPTSGLKEVERRLLEFLLLSGVRIEQAVTLKMESVDFSDNVIVWGRAKNGDPQILPMSLQMRALLKPREGAQWAFPMLSDEGRHLRKDAIHGPLNVALAGGKIRVADFNPHDMRRTICTGLARLGCPENVAELAIGHRIGGMSAIYNQHHYFESIKEWLAKWGAHVESLSPSTVAENAEAA